MMPTTQTRKVYKLHRPGPYLDRAIRILTEDDPNAFCDWLGAPRSHDVKLISSSFPAETLYADFVGQVAPDRLIHVEYIGRPDWDMAARMLSYRAQLMRQYLRCSIQQYALVHGTGRLPSIDDPKTGFTLGHRTIYLRERDPAEMLTHPGLAGLAILAGGSDAASGDTLRIAIHKTRGLDQVRERRLVEAMSTVAITRLGSTTVQQINEEDDVSVKSVAAFYRETNFGQEIHREGIEEGIKEGQGRGSAAALAAMLRARFGDDPRITRIAHHLAAGTDENTSAEMIFEATSVDDLDQSINSLRTAR